MKRLQLFFLTALLALSVNAQRLWKVTGKDSDKTSYLFGTHHVAPVSVIDATPGFADAFASVQQVYGELDMQKMTEPSVQMEMMRYTMAPADSTLSKVMPAETLDKLNALFSANQIPATAAALEPLKPAAVTNTVALILAKNAMTEFNPMQQLDMTIQTRAREAGKEVKGLEDIDTQMKVLFGAPISKQAVGLEKTLEDINKTVEKTRLMADAYMSADINKLADMINDPDSGLDEEETAALLTDRNNAWLEILLGAIPTASVMVVVGAGHLPGENGLINLLRKAGYNVEPVE